MSGGPSVPFGRPMRSYFLLDPRNINVNHGSFGTFPRPVLDALSLYQTRLEANPDRFIRYEFPRLLDKSRELLADMVNVDPDELVLVPNATGGVNTILRNLKYDRGDKIVYFSTAYGACEKTIDHITETTPAESIRIELNYPMSDDDLVAKFHKTLTENSPVKVAMFDTVSSLPGARIPFERLVDVCRRAGVLSLIDGAHGIGCIPLDLGKLDADFFVSNCHKWLYVPRGCALLHVPKRNQSLILSSFPTSHGYTPISRPGKVRINNPLPPSDKSKFLQLFEFVGTMDYSPYLCIPEALKFRKEICGGEEGIMDYCWTIALRGAQCVANILGTEVMEDEKKTITRQCCLVNIRLPLDIGTDVSAEHQNLVDSFVGKTMTEDYNSFVPTIFHNGHWWARISGQIYLALEDFEKVGTALLDVCNRIKNSEGWISG